MPLTIEQFTAKIQDIRNSLSDEAKTSELLTDLFDAFNEAENERVSLKKSNEELTTMNQSLKDSNMRLFLRVGQPSETKPSGPDGHQSKQEPSLKYEDLFTEKGALK